MSTGLPGGLEPYKRTPTFTEATVPAGLLNDHSTKQGTWGLIRVEEGRLRYAVTDPRRTSSERVLTPEGEPGIVEPTIIHRVEPLGRVRFHVEFFRRVPGVSATGPGIERDLQSRARNKAKEISDGKDAERPNR